MIKIMKIIRNLKNKFYIVKKRKIIIDAYEHDLTSINTKILYRGKILTLLSKVKIWYYDDPNFKKSKGLQNLLKDRKEEQK